MLKIAFRSLLYRKWSVLITISTLTLTLFLLILVSRVHQSSRLAFTKVISNTDLIVGPRTSPQNLLMYSALGIGQATHSVTQKSYNFLKSISEVKSLIPLSIGDSYRGFPVIATNDLFFDRDIISIHQGEDLKLEHMTAVLGAEVAKYEKLAAGSDIVIDHGGGEHSFEQHDSHPFKVRAILHPTGTPIDRFVFIHLNDFSLLHKTQNEPKTNHAHHHHDHHSEEQLNFNAFFVSLNNKTNIFTIKNKIDNFEDEALVSIIPGQVLLQFWENFKVFELAIEFMALALILMSVLSILSQILSGLYLRVKELVLFKLSGASNVFVLSIILLESVIAVFISVVFSYFLFMLLKPFIVAEFLEPLGLYINISTPTLTEFYYILVIAVVAILTSLLMGLLVIGSSKSLSVRINRGL